MGSIGKYFYFLKEAKNKKSVIVILLYILKISLFPFYKIFRIKFKKRFLCDISLKNQNGIYFCGKTPASVWICSLLSEKDIDRHLNLDKGIFIDIGANIGKYTIKIANQLKNNGRVIAIEPHYKNIEMLEKNISLNNLNNVDVVNKGCFHKNDIIKLYNNGHNSSHSILDNGRGSGFIKVVVEKLDSILEEYNLERVDLIKIDVEGVEPSVLMGAIETLKKYKPKIIFESDNKESLNDIKMILKPLNYKIYKINSTNYLAETSHLIKTKSRRKK